MFCIFFDRIDNLGPYELDMLSKKRCELLYSEASGVVKLTEKNKALDSVKVAVSVC